MGILIPPWGYAAAAGLAVAGGFYAGWTVQGWRWEARQAEALRKAKERYAKQLDEIYNEASEYERERERARQEGRARETEIRTIYRDVEVPAECEPPADALRLLDDAIRSANSRTGAEPGAAVPEPPGAP